MSEARRRNRHLHRVGADKHRPDARHCAIQHRLRDVEPDDSSPAPPEAERHNSRPDTDLEYGSFCCWELGVDESGVLVPTTLSSARLVIVLSKLIELAHGRRRSASRQMRAELRPRGSR